MAHGARAILSILNAATKSAALGDIWGANPAKVALDNAANVTIKAPAALTAVVTVQVAMTTPALDADFSNYQDSPGVDVVIGAGKTVRIGLPGCTDLRLISAGAEGAQRDFVVSVQEDMAG